MKDSVRQKLICAEAAVTIAVAKAAALLFPLGAIVHHASRPYKSRPFAPDRSDWIEWGVDTVTSTRWLQASSLARAIAMLSMLRRRGQAGHLQFGLVEQQGRCLVCSWVALADRRTLGYPAGARLISFGAAPTGRP
jgi:hypothetical protein